MLQLLYHKSSGCMESHWTWEHVITMALALEARQGRHVSAFLDLVLVGVVLASSLAQGVESHRQRRGRSCLPWGEVGSSGPNRGRHQFPRVEWWDNNARNFSLPHRKKVGGKVEIARRRKLLPLLEPYTGCPKEVSDWKLRWKKLASFGFVLADVTWFFDWNLRFNMKYTILGGAWKNNIVF